jgi:hypothetical protein
MIEETKRIIRYLERKDEELKKENPSGVRVVLIPPNPKAKRKGFESYNYWKEKDKKS